MDYRSFEGFDAPTTHNLRVLERLCQQSPYGDAESMQGMLESVLTTHKMLPKRLCAMVRVDRCLIGDLHMRASPQKRYAMWEGINADLKEGLDRVAAAREALVANAEAMLDRPVTMGERILATLKEFGPHDRSVAFARRLQWEGSGSEVAGMGRKLETLFSRKRIPDGDAHEREIWGSLARVRTMAESLHHRPG